MESSRSIDPCLFFNWLVFIGWRYGICSGDMLKIRLPAPMLLSTFLSALSLRLSALNLSI